MSRKAEEIEEIVELIREEWSENEKLFRMFSDAEWSDELDSILREVDDPFEAAVLLIRFHGRWRKTR